MNLMKVDEANAKEYGEFHHKPGHKIYDFDAIRQEIEDETHRHLAKGAKVVSPIPIYLTVYSPNVPNLTLVDMPGLTKVPIDGQPLSIVTDLEEMARTYIKGDNAIILAVTPANADLATSDALRLAKEVDPTGDRTIGVLTKVDIMDRGTDCRDILLGKTMRLKHGWVSVVNRGQADINHKVSMKDARQRERDFFLGHASYKDLENIGTTYLAEKLSRHLIMEIRKQLPSLSSHIDSNINQTKKELEALGMDIGSSRGRMLHLILNLIQRIEREFERIVDGGEGGGERILEVFEVKLKEAIHKLPFEKILAIKNVRNTINEADGYQPHIIAPEAGYRRLIEEGLTLLREPAAKCVEMVHQILKSITTQSVNSEEVREINRFVNLKNEIMMHATVKLDNLRTESELTARTLVDMEGSYLSANFFREIVAAESYVYDQGRPKPQFMTLSGEILLDKRYDNLPASDAHLARISDHVSAYLQIVRSQLLATIPKGIVHCMVLPAKKELLQALQEEIAGKDEPALRRLLSESEETAANRDRVRRKLDLLQSAKSEITMLG